MQRHFVATQIVSGRMKSPRKNTSWWTRHCNTVESYALADSDVDRRSLRTIVGTEAQEWERFRPRSAQLAALIAEHAGLEMGLADATQMEDVTAMDKAGVYLLENAKEQVNILEGIEGFPSSLYFSLVGKHVALFSEWFRMGPLRRAAKRESPDGVERKDWLARRRANTLSLAWVSTEWL